MGQATVTGGLVYDDVVALRTADSVVFSHYQGAGTVRLFLDDAGRRRVFKEREQRLFPVFPVAGQGSGGDRAREIAVASSMFGYAEHGGVAWRADGDSRPAGFFMIGSAHYADVWQTVARLLRRGDRLSLEWRADNNSELVRKYGLHRDELDLVVTRAPQQEGGRDRRMVFRIAAHVYEDNSARMVQRHGK